jgi:hypothetical protein
VECDSFVLVASRAAAESSYVDRERERATELGRPQVAVLAERTTLSAPPPIPTYDLTSSFARGVEQLAHNLATELPTGRRVRIRLPWPAAACLVASVPALCVLFVIVLGVEFGREVAGHQATSVSNADAALVVAAGATAFVAAWSAAILWTFLRRRVTWRYLRGWLFIAPLVVGLTWITVDELAGYLTTDPMLGLFGVSNTRSFGSASLLLVPLVLLASVAAAIATEFSPGLCRFLRTGTAPQRIRARHAGAIPRPIERDDVVRSYRLLAAEDDASVADEIRRGLAESGIDEVADGGERDRDIVVLTDKTPAGWLARDDLRHPLAVVATSISLPVRGVLHRFQWVDYRARRERTVRALGRDLVGASDPLVDARAAPAIPERLQQRRLPLWVVIVEWTLYFMAVLATMVAAYPLGLVALTDHPADVWPSALSIAVAVVLMLLARWLLRRRITLPLLLAGMALCWLAMIAWGLDDALQAQSSSRDRRSAIAATATYPALSVILIALAWRTLRRWLPRRTRIGAAAEPTLGSVRGSLEWLTMLVPALVSAVGLSVLNASQPVGAATAPVTAPSDVCRDHAGLNEFGKPFTAAQGAATAPERIPLYARIVRELAAFKPSSSWGADVKRRLIAGLERRIRADRSWLRREITNRRWVLEQHELDRAIDDLNAAIC